MNNQPYAFFFEIQTIPDDTILFNQFKEQKIFFSYFQVDQKYYLFFYSQKSIDIDLIDPSIHILEELNTKQRKIRSMRGFFLYALQIIHNGKDLEILRTNLKPSFWRNLKTILRQNKKQVLLQFLFGRAYSYQPSSYSFEALQDQIQTLKNQINSLAQQVERLQQKIIELENNQTLEIQTAVASALKQLLKSSQANKIHQQGDSTLKSEHSPQSPNLLSSDVLPKRSASGASRKTVLREVQNTTDERTEMEVSNANSFSNPSKIDFKPLSNTQQYNLSSNQEKGLNGSNFIKFSQLSEEEKIEIIKKGFQLQTEGKISLKKYYETNQEYSLFQDKGYKIKYEAIRKNKLYQQLKE